MSFWDSLRVGATALAAQRLRLDIISNNIANSETTRTAEGGPYQRRDVVFTAQEPTPFAGLLASFRRSGVQGHLVNGVAAAEIVNGDEPGPRVFDPSHPDADADGFVTYPNVDLVTEMTNLLLATRSYEAGLAVIEAAKRMALKALEIGRG